MTSTYFRDTSTGHVFETQSPEYYSGANDERMTRKAGAEAYKAQSTAKLLEILSPGDTVYTVLRSVSASGMSRNIDLYVFRDNKPVYLTGYVCDVLSGVSRAKGNGRGLTVGGCGMDMGFSVVYGLASVLWPHGTTQPHGTRNGEPDSTGGYALKQEWM